MTAGAPAHCAHGRIARALAALRITDEMIVARHEEMKLGGPPLKPPIRGRWAYSPSVVAALLELAQEAQRK